MQNFFQKRADEWKKSFKKKLEDCKQANCAIEKILGEYIFYSLNLKNLKYRIRKSAGTIENQVKNIKQSRKDIKDGRKLAEISKLLEDLRKKLRNI
ncbi:hypothetical protein KY346_03705 [Candidatus Woesearchaeota archaeon]|nr:hypothetical protein [Candidatus Woesearchaeota archaeon]